MVDDGRSGGNPEADLPLVSIGVPVRNGAAHLSEALESVLAQDYPRYEVIVCDNGSDDATPEIAGAFARRDGRFRYVSNGKDLGFLANFSRTLQLAHGTYFTWLAHDDLLSDRSYLSRTVRHLQDHPEVVCCFTGFSLSPFELAGSPDLRSFPEFSPDRWPAGRRQLFRWPHGWVDLAIYGVFRKAALDSVPIPHRTYRGRPHIFWWETEVLTALSGLGAIAALPEALRTYRRAAASAGHDAVSGVSTFDMLLLGLQIKYLLLVQALRLPVPPAEKLPVAATALGNLFRANLRQPFDHRRELRHLERQAAGLRRTAAERSRLLSSLRGVVAERRAAAGSTGEQMDDGSAAPPAPAAPEPRSRLTDYFSPPTPEQSGYYLALSRHVEGLRRHVEEQARRIEKLHSEAASLQEALEAGGRAGASDPLVSVGIPVYNGASHLAAAIDSVLGQDYCNLEVVLVDNASTDGTEAICRRYAEADPRVRYLRNGTNIGFLPNFRRALDESRGRYFTWLAHDDFLSDPSYLGTVVRYLEDHPDTVCCHTAINLLDNELKGSVEVMAFPEIAPERRWPKARRALFRWPHGWLDSVIYGVFRRSEIARIPFPEWTYRGRPHIFCWEMDVLTSLSAAGRIVALPECLRAYRLSEVSVGKQIGESVSSFDLLLLGLRMKLILLRRAATQPAGRIERAGLLATAVGNLFRANFRQPYDHRTVLEERENELRMLQKTAAERSRLIRFLRSEIAARKEIVASKGTPVEPDGEPSAGPAEDFPEPAAPDRSLYGRLTAFFRPLSAGQVRRLYELSEQIGRLREVCAGQEKEIERLSAEAAHWLEVMHQGAASRRA